jgi:hypothetical protein
VGALGYAAGVPSLFRRKSADLVPDATDTVTAESGQSAAAKPKAYTPSKKELGVTTPKRTNAQRRHDTAQAPANRREAYKQMRERQKVERSEASAGMRAGDERYLLARDRGPERALVRNIVDSKRTAGTWFFAGAILVFVGSTGAMPLAIRNGSTLLWAILAIAVVVDSILISRRIKKLVTERFPGTSQRLGSLYLYGMMRGLTFRRMRVPKPQVKLGDKI